MKTIKYVTGNSGKFAEASIILNDWTLQQVDIDIDEVQGERKRIAILKAKAALEQLNCPLIVEDVSVCCPALGGLPGPYIKDFLIQLGEEGIYNLLSHYPNRQADAYCTVCYAEPNLEPILFEGHTKGTVVPPKGELKHGKYSFNIIFKPDGHEKTFGEMSMEELSQFSMRSQALNQLKNYLDQHTLAS